MNPCSPPLALMLALVVGCAQAQPPAVAQKTELPCPAQATAATGTTGQEKAACAAARPVGATRGLLSYYGRRFAGRPTASGAPFDPEALTMAHRSLPFGTKVRVTHLGNGRSVVVEVNDRGPAVRSRIGDVSLAAARRLGMVRRGVIRAKLEVLPDAAAATKPPHAATP